jgi:hypothetical protein
MHARHLRWDKNEQVTANPNQEQPEEPSESRQQIARLDDFRLTMSPLLAAIPLILLLRRAETLPFIRSCDDDGMNGGSRVGI